MTPTPVTDLKEGVGETPELTIEVLKLLISIAEKEGLRSCKFVKGPSPAKGDGNSGTVIKIEIIGKNQENENLSVHIVIKTAATDVETREHLPIKLSYDREVYMYNSIFPEFQKFQQEQKVGRPFDSTVKCYVSSSKDYDECLVLADLKELGYTLKDCRTALNEDYVNLVSREYAKFHAVGLALKDQKPDLFQSLTGDWKDPMTIFLTNPDSSKMFKMQAEKAMETLDPIKHVDVRERLQKFVDEGLELLIEACQPGKCSPYDTIIHGDSWNNNFMFKDCQDSQTQLKVCILDWQTSRVSSPLVDLSYFIYTCAGKKSLDNLDYHLNTYYETLSRRITELGSNPEAVYPKSVFLSHWKKYCKVGLGMAIIVLPAVIRDNSQKLDLRAAFESGKGIAGAFMLESKNPEAFYSRMKDVILHHYERKYI